MPELSNFKVAGEKISKYATVRLLHKDMPKTDDVDISPVAWNQHLLSYSSPEFTATIDNDNLVVKNIAGQIVMTIRSKRIHFVSVSYVHVVSETGYLISEDNLGTTLITSLKDVNEGRRPAVFDNSNFIRVSPDLVGQKLMVLEFHDDKYRGYARVFTLEGRPIKNTMRNRPLARAKWGQKMPN